MCIYAWGKRLAIAILKSVEAKSKRAGTDPVRHVPQSEPMSVIS